MNIFVLSTDPAIAAQLQCDEHIVKMPLETAQMLSTVARTGLYKPSHVGHPCTRWAGRTRENFMWLFRHGMALCCEYTDRYGRTHKSEQVIFDAADFRERIPAGPLTPFVQCMPEQYKRPDTVDAYKAFYIGEKSKFATYNKSNNKPEWMP